MTQAYGLQYVWTNKFCLKSSTGSRLDVINIHVWAQIVHIYGLRDLSHSTDCLPALSGLASFYLCRAEPDEEYLAGLWRNDFAFCLGWQVGMLGRMPPASRAPSWSWASVDAEIKYTGRYGWKVHGDWAKIVTRDVCCKLKGINLFGEVVDGFAVVLGPVVHLNMLIVPNGRSAPCKCSLWHEDQTRKILFYPNVPLAPKHIKHAAETVVTCWRARS